jgi:hypothetical protein
MLSEVKDIWVYYLPAISNIAKISGCKLEGSSRMGYVLRCGDRKVPVGIDGLLDRTPGYLSGLIEKIQFNLGGWEYE